MATTDVFRENGLHVMARKCSTCIYRPGNLMRLDPGRKDGMQADAQAEGGVIPCHQTIHRGGGEAVCRGYFDVTMPGPTDVGNLFRVADRLGIIVLTDPAPKETP